MGKQVYLLLGIIMLYLIPSMVLQAVYGPSYGFMSGENYWAPDGNSGWVERGSPVSEPPGQASINVPTGVRYIPIFLPAILLFLFLFTPLSKYLDSRPATEEELAEVEKDKSNHSQND